MSPSQLSRWSTLALMGGGPFGAALVWVGLELRREPTLPATTARASGQRSTRGPRGMMIA